MTWWKTITLILGLIGLLAGSRPVGGGPSAGTGLGTVVALSLQPFALGLPWLTDIVSAGDDRLFAVGKVGLVRVVNDDGTVRPVPFLDISEKVSTEEEQGLASLVFHPDYAANGFFYVNYTDLAGTTHLARFSASAQDPNQADPNSEVTLLTVEQPTYIHNGADMNFGPDGTLYLALGDGGPYDDPSNNAQRGDTLLGKILRLDVDGGFPYAIPPDNPFVNDPAVLDEIWALGLRNPWRFSFDRLTGDVHIADVGERLWEEIDFQPAGDPAGRNYGWRCYEGNKPNNLVGCELSSNYTFPIFTMPHPNVCAVIGGYLYRGSQEPEINGHYLLADHCSGRVWGIVPGDDGRWASVAAGRTPEPWLNSFGEDQNGELYVTASGVIYRLEAKRVVATPQVFLPLVLGREIGD